MNPASRLGFFLILVSVTYIFARQPFFDRAMGWRFLEPAGNVTSREIFFFTRSSSIILSVDIPRDVDSTLIFLRPEEVGAYLQNQPPTGARTSRHVGSFTETLQIAQRGIHALVLNLSPPSPYLSLRISSQGISESEYTDQIIVFIAGVLLSLLSFFLKRKKQGEARANSTAKRKLR
ncbi:MAG: hypothetical protein QW506_05300 [Thermoproteota archaeon]